MIPCSLYVPLISFALLPSFLVPFLTSSSPFAPRAPEWLALFRFITHQTGLTLSEQASPRDWNICTGRHVAMCVRVFEEGGSTSASEGWREDTLWYEQMSPGPEQQVGVMPQGRWCSKGTHPCSPAGREERGDEPQALQALHLCSALLSSPCSLASPPPAHPFDSTIR